MTKEDSKIVLDSEIKPSVPDNNGTANHSLEEANLGSGSNTPFDGGRRRRRNGSRKNSWLAHVKATMKAHPDKSFKQVLKIAKKTYKRSQSQSKSQSKSQSQSQSQSGGRRRSRKYGKKRGGSSSMAQDMFQETQKGGSGMAGKPAFGSNAAEANGSL